MDESCLYRHTLCETETTTTQISKLVDGEQVESEDPGAVDQVKPNERADIGLTIISFRSILRVLIRDRMFLLIIICSTSHPM